MHQCVECGQPGTLMLDPFLLDVYGEEVETVLCDYHHEERFLEI